MSGQMVKFPANGGTADGYLATPSSGKGPGVIVIQEWWGLTDQIKGVADMFAREGFVALAPDFYHGKGAKIGEPDKAQKLMMEFFQANTAAKDAKGAAEYLSKHPAVTSKKVGVIGFCMGGFLALLVEERVVGFGVRVLREGHAVLLRDLLESGELGHGMVLAAEDAEHRDPAQWLQVRHALPDPVTVDDRGDLVRRDAANEQRKDVYRPDDAKDAWSKILPFLKSNVR